MPRYYDPEPSYGRSSSSGSRGGMSILDIIMARGQQEAEGARRSADIWGNAIGNAGQMLSGAIQDTSNRRDEGRVQKAITAARNPYPEATHPLPTVGADGTAVAAAPDPGANHFESILNSVPEALRPRVLKGFQDAEMAATAVQERRMKIAQGKAELQKAQQALEAETQKSAQDARDYGGVLATHLEPALAAPDGGLSMIGIGIQHAMSRKIPGAENYAKLYQQADEALKQAEASGDPAAKERVVAQIRETFGGAFKQMKVGMSPAAAKALMEEQPVGVNLPEGGTLVNPRTGQEIAKGEPKPETRSIDVQLAEAKLAGDTKRYGELLKVKSDEARAGRDPANAPGPDLSADGLDMAALNYRKTGIMPALGNGDKVTRKRIIDRAATLSADDIKIIETGGRDVASNKAVFRADSTALNALQKQTDAVAAFEATAKKNGALLEKAVKDIPDLGTKFFNAPIRAAADSLGSEKMATFNALRQSVVDEYARIIANPNLTGQMSDSARHEGDVLLNPNSTVKQFMAALKALRAEAGNRHTSYSEQLKEIKGRMGGQGDVAPPPAGTGVKKFRFDPATGQLVPQ